MSRHLLARAWRSQRTKLIAVGLGLILWGSLMPIVYEAFKDQIGKLFASGNMPQQFAQFGGGDLFSLPGAVALGFIHPIAVALTLVFALGFPVAAIAGERQRGTLEVILARPLSRRRLYLTMLAATWLFIGIAMAAHIAGTIGGSLLGGAIGELRLDRLPIMWLNGVLVFGAFGSVSLAASVSLDRLAPALGLSLSFFLIEYFVEVLGSLWTDAKWLQPYSVFHYLDPKGTLSGSTAAGDWLVPIGVIVLSVAAALVIFPRRDLAAPS